jgi:hypothetical protein
VATKQLRRASDLSDDLVETIVSSRPRSASLASRKDVDAFLRLYYADVPYEDLAQAGTPMCTDCDLEMEML